MKKIHLIVIITVVSLLALVMLYETVQQSLPEPELERETATGTGEAPKKDCGCQEKANGNGHQKNEGVRELHVLSETYATEN